MTEYDPDLDYHESETDLVLESLDPDRVEHYLQACRQRQRLGRAIGLGLAGGLAAPALWLGVCILSGRPLGWVAPAVGVAVGLLVRWAGRGVDTSFAVLGAWLALVACLLGDLLTGLWLMALGREPSFFGLLTTLSPALLAEVYRGVLSPGAVILHLLAVAAGYWLSARRITRREILDHCLTDAARARLQEAA